MTGGGGWRDRKSGGGVETYKQKKTEGKKIVNTLKKNKYLGHLQSMESKFAFKPTDQQHPHILHSEVRQGTGVLWDLRCICHLRPVVQYLLGRNWAVLLQVLPTLAYPERMGSSLVIIPARVLLSCQRTQLEG